MDRRKWKRLILSAVLILCFLAAAFAERRLIRQLTSQNAAGRWAEDGSFSQVTCFFMPDRGLAEEMLIPLRAKMNEALVQAAVGTGEETGRVLVDAYSSIGTTYIETRRASASVRTVGAGGDFFVFHPMKLLSGSYFDGGDVNGDGVVIDEDVAWKLFGATDIAGMEVLIGESVYPVRGVVQRDSGHFSEAAGEDMPTIYVSYHILKRQSGDNLPIQTYELLMVSPVTGFAANALKESMGMGEESYVMLENSTRFSLANRWKTLRGFGARSMKTDGMVFPWWENRARAYEDVSALLLVIEALVLIYPAVCLIRVLITLYRRCRRFSFRNALETVTGRVKGKKLWKR